MNIALFKICIILSASATTMLVNMCIFSSISALCFISFVFANRKLSSIAISKDDKIILITQNFITELLFSEYETVSEIPNYNYLFKNRKRKQILIAEIIKLHDSLVGDEAKKLEAFFNESGLIKQSFAKVKSTNKDLVLSGLGELVEMQSHNYIETLEILLKSTFDTELKNYLITAILKLDPKRGLDLILNAEHFLTDWFQLIIIKEIDELQFTDFPENEVWKSKERSIALFGERLYSYKNPQENSINLASSELVPLSLAELEAQTIVKNDNVLNPSSIEKALLDIYLTETAEIQAEIRNTLILLKSKIKLPDIPTSQQDRARKRLKTGSVVQKIKNAFKPNKQIGLYFLDWKNKIKPKT